MQTFEIIVALDKQNGIGKKNGLPWHISDDLKHFKNITTDHTVIMGKNTWHSLPDHVRPLPNRTTIVLTTHPNEVDHTHTYDSLETALNKAPKQSNIYIIGGGKVYEEAINHPTCKGLWVTAIHHTHQCDTFFPNIPKKFKKTQSTPKLNGEISFSFDYWTNQELT